MPVKYHGAKGIGVHGGGDGEEAHHHITGVGYGPRANMAAAVGVAEIPFAER